MNIWFVSANEGALTMTDRNDVAHSVSTVEEASALINSAGLDPEGVMFSSTMDYASEEGFANDSDARKMFYNAVEMVK